MRPPGFLLVCALLAAFALVLSGCGDDDGDEGDDGDEATPTATATATREAAPPREENAVSQAAARTTEAGSARVAYEALFDSPEGQFSFTGQGAVDYESHRGRLVYDMSNLEGAGGDEIEVRYDGPVAYVRFSEPPPDVRLPPGKEWVRIEPRQEEPAAAGEPQLDVAGVQQDPTQFLRFLHSGATDVMREGTEEVRGVETTIYTTLLDLERVAAHGGEELGADEDQQEAARQAARRLRRQVGADPLPVTVNVDDEGRIRRLLVSYSVQTGSGPDQVVSALTTTEYFDFGDDVEVEPPPEAAVADADELR